MGPSVALFFSNIILLPVQDRNTVELANGSRQNDFVGLVAGRVKQEILPRLPDGQGLIPLY